MNVHYSISFHRALQARHGGAGVAERPHGLAGRVARLLADVQHGLAARLQAVRGAPSRDAGPALEVPPPTGQPSDDWRPYIMRACLHTRLAQRYAPCLKERWPDKLEVAEELVYPDFKIRLPSFVEQRHQELWLQMCGPPPCRLPRRLPRPRCPRWTRRQAPPGPDACPRRWRRRWEQFVEDEHSRFSVDRGWAHYSHLHGQNLVFTDVTVPGAVLLALSKWGPTG
jgi:hypothetical protein